MLTNFIFVGIGGAIGAILRYGINELFERYLISSATISILFINILGCFLIGLVLGSSMPSKDASYYFFIIGFLGSFTTMSAVTHQTILIANTNLIYGVSYIMLTVLATIVATYLGTLITK